MKDLHICDACTHSFNCEECLEHEECEICNHCESIFKQAEADYFEGKRDNDLYRKE